MQFSNPLGLITYHLYLSNSSNACRVFEDANTIANM